MSVSLRRRLRKADGLARPEISSALLRTGLRRMSLVVARTPAPEKRSGSVSAGGVGG